MDDFTNRWIAIKSALNAHADRLAHTAGMEGCMHDGGAGALRSRIAAFEDGLARRIPAEWERIAAPLLDPEYSTYERLKAKFEGRH